MYIRYKIWYGLLWKWCINNIIKRNREIVRDLKGREGKTERGKKDDIGRT